MKEVQNLGQNQTRINQLTIEYQQYRQIMRSSVSCDNMGLINGRILIDVGKALAIQQVIHLKKQEMPISTPDTLKI